MNAPKKKTKVSILSPCYRGEPYLETFLENIAQQTIFDQCEIILDHNEPSQKEIEIAKQFQLAYPNTLVHNIVNKVVPITVSINNCIRAARGEYLCTGCVDDQRTPDSIERMCMSLDENPDAGFTYGDQVIVDQVGKRDGIVLSLPDFDKSKFLSDHYMGSFIMFRKEVINKYGYWDEQLLSASDLDFQIRLALVSNGKKTEGIVGYFLNIGQGASTGGAQLRKDIGWIERHVIYLRYGQYDRLNIKYVPLAKKYDLFNIINSGKKIPIKKLIPQYQDILNETERQRGEFEESYRNKLFQYYVKIGVPEKIRGIIRKVLSAVGLLKPIRKLLGRDHETGLKIVSK